MNQYFIEQLIASIQSALWLIVLGLLLGLIPENFEFEKATNFIQSPVGTGLVLSYLYVVGIIIDGLGGYFTNNPQDEIKRIKCKKSLLPEEDKQKCNDKSMNLDTELVGTVDMMLRVKDCPQLADGFLFFRRTSRILASTFINALLLFTVLPLYLSKIGEYYEATASIIFLIIFMVLLIFGWKKSTEKYYDKLFETVVKYDELNKK